MKNLVLTCLVSRSKSCQGVSDFRKVMFEATTTGYHLRAFHCGQRLLRIAWS